MNTLSVTDFNNPYANDVTCSDVAVLDQIFFFEKSYDTKSSSSADLRSSCMFIAFADVDKFIVGCMAAL